MFVDDPVASLPIGLIGRCDRALASRLAPAPSDGCMQRQAFHPYQALGSVATDDQRRARRPLDDAPCGAAEEQLGESAVRGIPTTTTAASCSLARRTNVSATVTLSATASPSASKPLPVASCAPHRASRCASTPHNSHNPIMSSRRRGAWKGPQPVAPVPCAGSPVHPNESRGLGLASPPGFSCQLSRRSTGGTHDPVQTTTGDHSRYRHTAVSRGFSMYLEATTDNCEPTGRRSISPVRPVGRRDSGFAARTSWRRAG